MLVALGVVLIWSALIRLTSGTWPEAFTAPFTWLAETRWDDPAVWALGTAVAVAGLILLLAGLIPGRYHDVLVRLPSADGGTARDAGNGDTGTGRHTGTDEPAGPDQTVAGEAGAVMSRRAVAQLASATCEHIDGVSSASATATDRDVRVSVETALHDSRDLHRWVADGVQSRLAASGLDPVPRVRVAIRSRD